MIKVGIPLLNPDGRQLTLFGALNMASIFNRFFVDHTSSHFHHLISFPRPKPYIETSPKPSISLVRCTVAKYHILLPPPFALILIIKEWKQSAILTDFLHLTFLLLLLFPVFPTVAAHAYYLL
jgi:hypothetical protein